MYERIYDYWKREKYESSLQPIDKDFYKNLANYLWQLRESLRKTDEKTAKAKLAIDELKRAENLFKELLQTRLRKILRITESETGSEMISQAATEEEKVIFENAVRISKQYESILQMMLAEEDRSTSSTILPELRRVVAVRFLVEIPAIVGVDLRPYGPFKPEDVATLPLENAEALVKGRAAVKVVANKLPKEISHE